MGDLPADRSVDRMPSRQVGQLDKPDAASVFVCFSTFQLVRSFVRSPIQITKSESESVKSFESKDN